MYLYSYDESRLSFFALYSPSLEDISAHPFLAEQNLPSSIPLNATHVAPEWTMNGYGEFVFIQDNESDKYAPSKPFKKPSNLPSGRRPLGQRDPNTNGVSSGGTDRLKKGKSERDVINVQGLVRNTMASSNTGNKLPAMSTPASSPFQIYDESKAPRDFQPAPSSLQGSCPPHGFSSPDDLIPQTNALSIREGSAKTEFGRAQSVVSAVSSNVGSAVTVVNTENDANILHQMLGNLETVMEITRSRKGSYPLQSPRPVSRGGPTKWVTRYVDYTSKYGLGFLLNDGRYVVIVYCCH